LSSTSVQPQQIANIVEADDDNLIDRRLLLDLSDMEIMIDRNTDTAEERVLSIMCQELLTVGYQHIKAKMNRGDVPLGNLCYGSAWNSLKVGPVVEFISPLEECECMWCANQKAIDVMERWPTFDDFYDDWNERLGHRASCWDGIVVVREYRSKDYGMTDKYPCFPVTNFITLNWETLHEHWTRASVRVEALKRIDQMRDRIQHAYSMRRNRSRREDEIWLVHADHNHRNMRRCWE